MPFTINVSYDQSTNMLPSGFTGAVQHAVTVLTSQFTDNVTINLNVGYGEQNATPLARNDLGRNTMPRLDQSESFSDIRSRLHFDSKDLIDGAATETIPLTDPISGSHTYEMSQAEAVALQLLPSTTSITAYVGFSNTANFDYIFADGTGAGQVDFVGVVEHEITEVMGRFLRVGMTDLGVANTYTPLDLFHYSAPNTRDLSGTTAGYFSIDGGTTNLKDFSTRTGGDFGDWASSAGNDAFNAISLQGVDNELTETDLIVMDVIGWDRVADDIRADARTTATLATNQQKTGNIEASGDRDWFSMDLVAGITYQLVEAGVDNEGGTLADPYLRLYDANSNLIGHNDDGEGHDSVLSFTPTTSGRYYLSAGRYFDEGTGTYTVRINVGDDFLATTASTADLAIGTTRTGGLEVSGDHDWFRVQLTAGRAYVFGIEGTGAGLGSLDDAFLRLRDSSGTQLASNDDGGVLRDSRLVYTATASGTYFVDVGGFNETNAGTYTVSAAYRAEHNFDGKGASDVLWQNSSSNAVGYWQVSGGHVASFVSLGNGGAYLIAGSGDFNGDGESDVLLHNSSSGDTGYWNTANGTTTWVDLGAGGSPYQIAGAGDFNHDGTSDVLWHNSTSGDTGYWNETSGHAAWVDLGNGGAYQIAGVGDFNRDGTSDVLWHNNTSGDTGYWNTSSGQTAWVDLGNGGSPYQIAGVGDFNGDGISDVLWHNSASGDNGYWNTSSGHTAWVDLGAGAPGYQITGIGDYNGDGVSDILWQNSTSNAVGFWNVASGTPTWNALGTGAAAWQIVST